MTWFLPLAGGMGYSACMLLAGPPLGWWPLSLVALAPLVWGALREGGRFWRDGLLATVGAVPLWAVTQSWVHEVSVMGYVPLVAALALCVGAFVALLGGVARTMPRLALSLAVPALWTGLEFLRGEILCGGYAWGFVVHPLIDSPGAALMASKGGVYLVSAFVAMLVGMAFDVRRARRATGRVQWLAVVTAFVMSVVFFVPDLRRPPAGRSVRVAVVQTNIPQSNKIAWTIEEELAAMARFEALTRDAAAQRPALIVWPETMMPGLSLEPSALAELRAKGLFFRVHEAAGEREVDADEFAKRLFALSREIGVPMLVGEEAWEGLRIRDGADGIRFEKDHRFNSVYLVRGGALGLERYDKMSLTPFGEVMPYVRHWPALQQQLLDLAATGMAFDLSEGQRRAVFTIETSEGPIRAVTPICFESTSAGVCRTLAYDGGTPRTDLVVIVTNDGWFGDSDLARAQHLQMARWRAAELGVPVVRAANTGISAVIDARGRVVASGIDSQPGAARVDGVLTAEVTLSDQPTFFARLGNAAGWFCLSGGVGLGIAAAHRRRVLARTSLAGPA
ncbi:MAG: apolipoprotein N-acyltransferase [Phycisphaerae bacterium]|nr:MAG: apolipoprotein N-acyltransferase [Phycisphaerae bacterium]